MRKQVLRCLAVLLCVSMVMLSLSGCYVVKLAQVLAGGEGPAGQSKQVKSQDGQFALTIPAGWRDVQGQLNEHAVLEAAKGSKEEYVAVFLYNKADVDETMSLQEIAQWLTDSMTEEIENADLSDSPALMIMSHNAPTFRLEGLVDNLKIIYWMSYVETDNEFVQILGWTLSSMAEDNEAEIRNVMETFQAV